MGLRQMQPGNLNNAKNRILKRKSFGKGETMFRAGDPGNFAYFIETGDVDIVLPDGSGGELLIARLGPGEVLGEMALIDGQPRCASAVAADKVVVALITTTDLQKLMDQSAPGLVGILKTLIARLRRTDVALIREKS